MRCRFADYQQAGSAGAGDRKDPEADKLPGMDHVGTELFQQMSQTTNGAKIDQPLPTQLVNLYAFGTQVLRMGGGQVCEHRDPHLKPRARQPQCEQLELLAGAAYLQRWDDE
jgi:hypothetical protein